MKNSILINSLGTFSLMPITHLIAFSIPRFRLFSKIPLQYKLNFALLKSEDIDGRCDYLHTPSFKYAICGN